METSGIIHSLSMRKGNKKYKDNRPGIIVIGDSLAQGCAGELLHHVEQHYNVMGYTKPNAGLLELFNTAKEVSSKLTKKDTVIVLGGTNDMERNMHQKNLTSIEKFLDSMQ